MANTNQHTSTIMFKGALLVLGVVLLVCSQVIWDIASSFRPESVKAWLDEAGRLAPLLYMAVMTAAVVISPIPSLPLDIAAGAFFGPWLGTLYSVIGALCGAVISFMIARLLGRDIMERVLGGHVNFCERCSDRVLTRIVFISRLLPVVSFDIISYGAGLTKMSLKHFSAATFIGMIPLTFLYNYSGSVLVFGSGLTVVLGVLMVVLFFALPRFLEGKGLMTRMEHD